MIDNVSLQRGLPVDQRRDDVAVMNFFALFENDDVAVEDVRADHRIAANAKRERAVSFRNVRRVMIERDVAFDILLGQRGHAGRDLSVNRHVVDPNFLDRRDQRACFAGVTLKKSFFLQRGNVLHHRRLAGEPEMTLDFARARGDAFFPLLPLDEIENVSLAFG